MCFLFQPPTSRAAVSGGGGGGGAGIRARTEADDGPYELGKTPSDAHQQEADSFQELVVRTQRNLIDVTQGSVGGVLDSADVLERQRDVAKLLEGAEPTAVPAPLWRVPVCSAAADPVRVLQEANVTMEDEEALRLALAAVARAHKGHLPLKGVGKVVDNLPPIAE